MTCAIMQPTFNPWLGYFDLIDQSDVFVIYDDVQISKQSWQVRNRIKTAQGELFLSVPYLKGDNWRELLICEAQTNELLPWRKKHLKSIENSYKKAPHFEEIFSFITDLYHPDFNTIALFNTNTIKKISDKIGINTNIIQSSGISGLEGTKDLRLLNICKTLHVTDYLSPQGSANYIEEFSPGGELVKGGIDVYYHNYKPVDYPQINGDFMPYMGIFDLLFNVGFNEASGVIRAGRLDSISYKNFKH